ncbi:MAG: ribokinase [Alphaproteobacteria bacterium]|nr:ribokinase [Alphaproteobacteria bacterium]
MMAPLLAFGLPLLAEAVKAGLRLIDRPAASAAADAIDAVTREIRAGEVPPEQLAEANRHAEAMARMAAEEAGVALTQVNETIRTEANAPDPFVRRWRPFFGYVVACSWGVQMGAAAVVIVIAPEQAGSILSGLGALSAMWGVALGVLGVAVVKRSQDKAVEAGFAPAPTLLDALFGRRPATPAPPPATPAARMPAPPAKR